jgi:glycosyltransferase involved in cell wall biosynthesis
MIRPDVKEHFDGSWEGNISGVIAWMESSGRKEENLGLFIDEYQGHMYSVNAVHQIYEIYAKRNDLQKAFPNLAFNISSFNNFLHWLEVHGINEENVTIDMIRRFSISHTGFIKSLILYYQRPDLQVAFPDIHKSPVKFFNWLKHNINILSQLSEDDIYAFYGMARFAGGEFKSLQVRYNKVLIEKAGGPLGFYNFDLFTSEALKHFGFKSAKEIYEIHESFANPLRELEYKYSQDENLQLAYPQAFNSSEALKCLVNSQIGFSGFKNIFKKQPWIKKLQQQSDSYTPNFKGINLAGYIDAATGMGQSSRSMLSTIKAAGLRYSVRTLPNMYLDDALLENKNISDYFGRANTEFRINLIISNADAIRNDMLFFPKADSLDRINVGYWVWETEELPNIFMHSSDSLDEIWTASEYSASAIRKCVDVPVNVLPHVLDFEEINEILTRDVDRSHFGLPDDTLLFGFFFDQKSVFERKNPKAVIQAFRKAFSDSKQNIALVLKVNTPQSGELQYEMLKAENKDINIIWIEETLSRNDTLSLMNCLDVYVSLHRAEGFGLTIAEAMALKKPVIATNYSGNIDFMDETSSLLVDFERIKTTQSNGPYPRGTRWAEPNITHASMHMRSLTDSSLRTNLGIKAREHVENCLHTNRVSQILLSLINGFNSEKHL